MIIGAGWQPWYPGERFPSAYRDPDNPACGMAWLAAYETIINKQRRQRATKYFVQRSWHEGPTCNKWCVWYPCRALFRVCESKETAEALAQEMNTRPEQLKLFSQHIDAGRQC